MGLDFSKTTLKENKAEEVELTKEENEIISYDVVADRKELNENLANSKEVDAIVETIDLGNINGLVTFGGEAATEVSKASDIVLSSVNVNQVDKTGKMLSSIASIMKKIDINEIKKEPNAIGRFFGNAKAELEKLLGKYEMIGTEVDKICVELHIYEDEIKQANVVLKGMFDSNVKYYHELVKYILAGEQACKELKAQIEKRTKDYEDTNASDKAIEFELNNLKQCLSVLEQRTQDLRLTENIALQSIPMINTMAFTNINLVRKINSAFIVTLPIFKQAVAQAVLLKRQYLQTKMMKTLDEKTNELLIQNAKNTIDISKESVKLASGSSVKIETLEETWKIITEGIEEVKTIQNEASKKCIEDAKRLEEIKKEFGDKFVK